MVTATVMKVGNSRAICIPKSLVGTCFEVGSKVEIELMGSGLLSVRAKSPAEQRIAAFDELVGFTESVEQVPWADDSREADRRLLGDRLV